MPLYDFKCSDDHISELYAKMDERTKICQCGKEAKRLITSRYYIQTDYATSDFVTADITGIEVMIISLKHRREFCKRQDARQNEGKPETNTLPLRLDNKLHDRWV